MFFNLINSTILWVICSPIYSLIFLAERINSGVYDYELSGAIYRAVNHDDLQFINTNAQNGLGYFDNIGKTIRQDFRMTQQL